VSFVNPIPGAAAVPGLVRITFPNVAILFGLNESAACVDVLKFPADVVAMNKLFAIERKAHASDVADPSVSASCGAVDDESVRVKRGEVVPIPTTAFTRLV
jgi:hypothetical protein